MEKLTEKSKELLLHRIKQEFLINVHNLSTNDLLCSIDNTPYGDVMIIELDLRRRQMLTNEDIESINRCTN